MPNVGPMELAVILVLALLIFGPKKLPEIGKGVGQAMREFKKASRDFMSSFNDDSDDRPRPAPAYDSYAAAPASDSYPSPASDSYAAPAHTQPADPQPLPTGETRFDEPAPPAMAAASPNGTVSTTDTAPAEPGRDTAHAPERTT